MFIRHNALGMMKNLNNTRPVIQAIEQGFHLVAQMVDSRVSLISEYDEECIRNLLLDFECSIDSADKYDQIVLCRTDQ